MISRAAVLVRLTPGGKLSCKVRIHTDIGHFRQYGTLNKEMDAYSSCLKAQYSCPASPTLGEGRLLRDLAKPLTEIVALRAKMYLDQRLRVRHVRSKVQEFKASSWLGDLSAQCSKLGF